MPTRAAPAASDSPLRCLQRPTGEWFTFATGNAAGKDTPDATDLLTETEARERLEAAGLSPAQVEAALTAARANPEVSGGEQPVPDPVIGLATPAVDTSPAGGQ